jgi:hypothetical protein
MIRRPHDGEGSPQRTPSGVPASGIDFQEILSRVTISDILASAGLTPSCNRMACPIHDGDNSTSFSFTDSTFICFSCSEKGGLMALDDYLHGCSRLQALRELCRLADLPFDEPARPRLAPRRLSPVPSRNPLAENGRYWDLVNRLSWTKFRRYALLVGLRLSRRSMREHKTPLVDYYTKDLCCLQELQELDEEVNLLNYEENEIKREIHTNGNYSTESS